MASSATTTVELTVAGMSCEGCVDQVSNVLARLEGVRAAEVSLEGESAEVEYDPETTGLEAMKEVIETAGYGGEHDPVA